ncbi:hypothetical protein Dimus_017647 [Dionaea muscipula]
MGLHLLSFNLPFHCFVEISFGSGVFWAVIDLHFVRVLMLQKWSKGKQKEKVNNMVVLFDQATYDKLLSEVPKYKLVTPSILSDRLRVYHLLPSFPICLYR